MLKIGQLATQAKVSRDTLRFYEKHGLITPTNRNVAGYRLYSDSDIHRIPDIVMFPCLFIKQRNASCTHVCTRLVDFQAQWSDFLVSVFG